MLYLELTIMFYTGFYTALCMNVIDPVPKIKLNLTETTVGTQSEEMQQKIVTELEKFCNYKVTAMADRLFPYAECFTIAGKYFMILFLRLLTVGTQI